MPEVQYSMDSKGRPVCHVINPITAKGQTRLLVQDENPGKSWESNMTVMVGPLASNLLRQAGCLRTEGVPYYGRRSVQSSYAACRS